MDECRHTHILLMIQNTGRRLRCRHCHLTIKPEELDSGYCPECLSVSGERRSDFETIDPPENSSVQYRCEDCGAMLNPITT